MADTLIQKIMARASGRKIVSPGEIVTCNVDLAMILDSGGPRKIWPRLKELNVGVYDKDKVVVVADHFVPAADPQVLAQAFELLASDGEMRHRLGCAAARRTAD